jgi:short subunit dehydrogenase-like uncharacterized protein
LTTPLLLYGCYGYTGRLLAEEAVRRGLRPTLAGRDRDAVQAMGRELGLPARVGGLEDRAGLDAMLADHKVVLHAAGPFSRTSAPMVEACLRTGAHYLDVTGELGVFEAIARRDAEAKARGVLLLPGVGFDVVPSDCLAAHVAGKVLGARSLTIALSVRGRPSQGTALTIVENLGKPGAVRRDGRITLVPPGYHERLVDFGEGPTGTITIPWGDVSTAFYSTGIPDITVYLAMPPAMRLGLRVTRLVAPLLGSAPVRRILSRRIKAGPAGPSAERRERGSSRLYAEAVAPDGRRAAARLLAPEAYLLTAAAGVRIAERALAGSLPVGFQTPSRALGADFVLELPGVSRSDV